MTVRRLGPFKSGITTLSAQRVWIRARRWLADTLRIAAETIDS
jgi:hypothetical protein